jgi:hypothetical protein
MGFTKSMFVGIALLVGVNESVEGKLLTLETAQAVVTTDGTTGASRVLIQFDLSTLPEGGGRVVDDAFLEWPVAGISSNTTSVFSVRPLTAAWSNGSVAAALDSEALVEPTGEWEFGPLDYERNGGGLVKFDVSPMVRYWLKTQSGNYGLLIETVNVSSSTLGAALASVRLHIHYGFVE